MGVPPVNIKNIIAARAKRDQELKAGTAYRKESERTSTIPLQDYNLEKSKINRRFGAYVATQLTYAQYKQLFSEQLRPQIEAAVRRKLEIPDSITKLLTPAQLYEKEAERLITANYYRHDKELMKKQLAKLDPQLKPKISKENLNKAEIAKHNIDFIRRAGDAGLSKSQIADLLTAKAQHTQSLMAHKKFLKDAERTHGIAYIDNTYDKHYFTKQYQRVITQILNEDQFRKWYYPILKDQIARKETSQWDWVRKSYEVNAKQAEQLEAVVLKYSEALVMTEHYYSYDDQKKLSELTAMRHKARHAIKKKAKQLGLNRKALLADEQPPDYRDFIEKARATGVAEEPISKIIQGLEQRAIAFEDIRTLKKRHTGSILVLDELKYSTSSVRDAFKKYLTKHLTLPQYSSIFKDQIQRLAARKLPSRMKEIKETYQPNRTQQREIQKLVQKQLLKKVATESYYSYDSKVAKQQLRALKFREENSYQKQLKAILAKE